MPKNKDPEVIVFKPQKMSSQTNSFLKSTSLCIRELLNSGGEVGKEDLRRCVSLEVERFSELEVHGKNHRKSE
jgi:hypothetical protein